MVRDIRARVVEVLRTGGSGSGSGYAVAADLVLTAAHVVNEDTDVRIVAGGDELPGVVAWRDAKLDAALVRVPDPQWGGVDTRWTTLAGVRRVQCIVIGYPRAQQADAGVRVEEQISGFVMPVTGSRIGRYAINVVSALPYESARAGSPWAGMSGAAVLTEDGGQVLGVLTDDPASFEPSRLEAVPVEALLDAPAFAELVGADAGALVRLTDHDSDRAVLDDMKRHANLAVRYRLGSDSEADRSLVLERAVLRRGLTDKLLEAGTLGAAVLVRGESGTGKSSLVLSVVADLEAGSAAAVEAIVVNLRRVPQTIHEFTQILGCGIGQFLQDLLAPSRLLVIDGADAALEGRSALLAELAAEARRAGAGLVVVSADTAADVVADQVRRNYVDPETFTVPALDDDEIATVAGSVPRLAGLLHDLPERSLLRRLVVLDLLSRTGLAMGTSMTDWECLEQVWRGLVRRNENYESGSPEARERALLALAEDALGLPADVRQYPLPESAAVDQLRRDYLLAPPSLLDTRPQFAHDEVRRYATAVVLLRAGDIAGLIERAGAPRWSLSAAQLACQGQFARSGAEPSRAFARADAAFVALGSRHGARWADVPIEAALASLRAFELLRSVLPVRSSASNDRLEDLLRVVEQRYASDGLLDVERGVAAVRVLLEHDRPWLLSDRAFTVIAAWLQSLVVGEAPAGSTMRGALRDKLLAHWADYASRQEKFVELLALLGADINDEVAQCLMQIATRAPASLAPAVDAPLSARGVAQYNVELLAMLAEAYYIDETDRGQISAKGVRRHRGRWYSPGPPFAAFYFGAFWPLFHRAAFTRSAAVLNKLLNHASRRRVDDLSRPAWYGPASDSAPAGQYTVSMRVSGVEYTYVGDSHVWDWFRGSSVGPYPCMSALQAMERVIDALLEQGVPMSHIVEPLLDGCENLAVPGLLFDVMVRHLKKADGIIDLFLREPAVWQLETGREVRGHLGPRAAYADELVNAARRRWPLTQVCMSMVLNGDSERRAQLQRLGRDLEAAGNAAGTGGNLTNWAASLDISRYQTRQEGDQVMIEVSPPPERTEFMAEWEHDSERRTNLLRLQNRYWGGPRLSRGGDAPLTAAEIAADLAQAKDLLKSPPSFPGTEPGRVAAHVAAAAIRRAARVGIDALGGEATFAVNVIMGIASGSAAGPDDSAAEQYFDLEADRPAATALPCLIVPALQSVVMDAGYTQTDVDTAALGMASGSPRETRLYLARGCDEVWRTPCAGEPCIHLTALAWVTETARRAELGQWDAAGQRLPRIRIDGDLAVRLLELDGRSTDPQDLDAAIRGCGAAAAECCVSGEATTLLGVLLPAHRMSMLAHHGFWSVDDGGEHSLIAARALLQTTGTTGRTLLDHITALAGNAYLLTNLLHGLAAAGAESSELAGNARRLWPTIMRHVMAFASADPNPFQEDTWGEWALTALIPEPLTWSDSLHNEVASKPVDWVDPHDLLDAIPAWVELAQGSRRCLDHLIHLAHRLAPAEQVNMALKWVAIICIQDESVRVHTSHVLDDWLIELRPHAEALDCLPAWQLLTDRLVAAGNRRLAPYSV